jgi:hypothetical protein
VAEGVLEDEDGLALGVEAPELLGDDEAPALLLGDEAPELGCADELELELESLLGAALLGAVLEPPEAEPDLELSELAALEGLLAASLEPDPPGVTPTDVLDELEPGAEAPPDGAVAPPDGAVALELEEPGAVEGAELGEVALLELEEPGADVVLLALSRSQAARPKAIATAIARVESFMGPPWLGYERNSNMRARTNPLIDEGLCRAR